MFDLNFDKKFKKPVIGIDEVGRGSWAGPVMAGAALLNFEKPIHKKLNDSKKLSPKVRYEIFENLKENINYGVGESSNFEIDKYGIQKATFLAMERALKNLIKKTPYIKVSSLLIDGTQMPYFQNKFTANIKLIKNGDSLSPSIAAASICAKCTRDSLMCEIDKKCIGYGFKTNMGYGTKHHKKKLLFSGPTRFHRMTFSPMKSMI